MKTNNPESIYDCFDYVLPEPEKCCKKCAFFDSNRSYLNDGGCQCRYLSYCSNPSFLGGSVKVNDLGCCKHFFSKEHSLLFNECNSKDEFDLKLDIFGIELDELLRIEIEDGFGECEKATEKMQDYARNICDSFLRTIHKPEPNKWLPMMINLKEISADGGIWKIRVSDNFFRINQYIKANDKEFREKYTIDGLMNLMNEFCEDKGYNREKLTPKQYHSFRENIDVIRNSMMRT